MEFENTKFTEDLYQPVILPNSYLKSENGDEFGFDSCSSKDGGFFHDLHNLEHHHQDFSILDPIDHQHPPPPPPRFDNFYDPKDLTMQNFDGRDGGGEAVVGRRLSPLNCEVVKPVSSVVPDEGSSSITSGENGYYTELIGGRSKEARKSSKISRRMKTNSVKGQWTMDEDRTLIHLVEKYGVRKWSQIAQMLKGRVGKQCRERWHNHLRPDIKKDTWSEEEDKILIEAHAEIGNKWAEIAKRLPGRTENSIKNHWNATKRRQYSRRKCRSKYPKPSSLLQNYIKSLMNLPDTNPPSSPAKTLPPPPPPVVDTQMDEETTNMEEFCASDRLVPDYDFNDEVPEFRFNENLFEEGRIDTILDTVGPAPPLQAMRMEDDHEERFEMEDVPVVRCEVKKEMDLMEMISQGNF